MFEFHFTETDYAKLAGSSPGGTQPIQHEIQDLAATLQAITTQQTQLLNHLFLLGQPGPAARSRPKSR